MQLRWIVFVSVVTLILSGACFYVGTRILSRLDLGAGHTKVVWVGMVGFVLLQLLGPLLYRSDPNITVRSFIFQWMTYTTMGLFACLFFYTVFSDLAIFALKKIKYFSEAPDLNRRVFMGTAAASVVSAAVGVVQALQGPRVYRVEVPIQDLPQSLEGFKIVQISDLHVGPLIHRDYATQVVKICNDLQPDLIAVTGDLIDGEVAQLKDHCAPLGELKAKNGVYFVTGNHEYYWNALSWIEHVKSLGMKVLHNEHEMLKVGDAYLAVAGVCDLRAHEFFEDHRSNPKKAILGAPIDAIKILLAHQPNSFKEAVKEGYHLQLSGHTHAGQFFPWSIAVAAVYKHYKGLGREEKMWIYVNRGTGYWGPPMRFTVPSEITELILVKA